MNLIDVAIILLLLSSLVRGAEVGAVRQVFSTAGFFLGLFFGAWLEPHFAHLAHSAATRSWVALLITLGLALAGLGAGEYFGILLKKKLLAHQEGNFADRSLGSVVGAITMLVTVWFAAAILVTLPFLGLANDLKSSAIVGLLDRNLPPAPNVIADLSHVIDPNGFPKVFNGNEPAPPKTIANLPSLGSLDAAVSKDQASVVKIEGSGCGGIVEGSGFVVANGLVATNAHVVAGVAQPYVMDKNGTHSATPIWFDPDLDFAVLAVSNLAGQPLKLNVNIATDGTAGAAMGYPGGGDFTADPALVLDEFVANGQNIYNQGTTSREIYEIKATVIPGNSGGPLVNIDGQVIGIIFAQSTSYNQVGYALTLKQASVELRQAEQNHRAVTTGACAI